MTSPVTRLGRLADLAYRRRGRMVLAWIAALAAVIALAPVLAGDFDADFGTSGSESEEVASLLQDRFDRSGEFVTVAWDGADTPGAQRAIQGFLDDAEHVKGVGSAEGTRVSPEGTIGVTQLQLEQRGWDVPPETGQQLIRLAGQHTTQDVEITVGGVVIQNAEDGGSPEGIGMMAAAVILLIAFGSVVAAGLPLAVALFGLGISASLITVLAAFVDVPDFAPAVAGLIGIGVGIDYALLVLTRYRAALETKDPRDAVREAIETAGRSVLIAGTTVLISVNGLFLMGVSYLQGVALSTSLAVLAVMAASVTLLPALLAFAGRKVNRLRIPGLGRGSLTSDHTPAARWSRMVQRRPAIALIAATALVLTLTAPVLDLRLGFPDAGNDREGTPTRTTYDMISRGFGPGSNGPLLVASTDPQALEQTTQTMRETQGVAFVSEPQRNEADDAALLTVVPTTSPQDSATSDLVDTLRAELPADVLVGGTTAAFVDQSELVSARLPLFIAGVVGLSFLLLLAAFRSPLIALKAGVMNLLSVGAAYGVISLFAQGTWAGELIGIDTATPVAPFIPVMMFAILFGLSMDYEVFLLSRVREEYLRHGDTAKAVS